MNEVQPQPTSNPSAGQTPAPTSNKTQTILIVVLVVVLVLLGLILVRGYRQGRMAEEAKNNTIAVNTVLQNTVTNNTSVNNTVSNTSNETLNTTNTTGTGKQGGSVSGAPTVVSSNPASGSSVATSAISSVSVTFNTALDSSSLLSVTKVSLPQHVGTGVTTFSNDKKTMTLSINATSNSVYTVHYTACTGANVNCATGNISFTVGSGGTREPAKAPTAE